MRTIVQFLSALVSLLAATCLCPIAAATVGFSDGTFNDSDWTLANFNFSTTFPSGGTSVAAHQATGGNPDDYRQINISVNATAGQGSVNGIYSLNLRSGAVYDPSTSGPIDSLAWALDCDVFSIPANFGVERGPLLFQNGTYFVTSLGSGSSNGWAHSQGSGLHPGDFFNFTFPGNPNFSAAGGPITFGFYEFCFTQSNAPGYTAVTGIDNWSVSISQVPEPSGLVLSAAATLVLLRGRRTSERVTVHD